MKTRDSKPYPWIVAMMAVLAILFTSGCPEKIYITVSYDANGGSPQPDSVVTAVGGQYWLPANVTRPGYTLTGWFTSKEGEGVKVTSNTLVPNTDNHTLYARWSLNQYTIAYVLDGGQNNPANPASYTIESATIELGDPTKAGYDFDGWFGDAQLEQPSSTITQGSTGNKTFYAAWVQSPYTVNFDANGGWTPTASKLVYSGDSYGTLPTATRTGYTFGGWYDGIGGTGTLYSADTPVVLTADQTLYARWTATSYSIAYNLDGGTNHADNPNSYTIEVTPVVLKDPNKTGYVFDGWYSSSNFIDSNKTTGIALGGTGTKTFYAKWSLETYTVTFDANGGTAMSVTLQVNYGKAYSYLGGYNYSFPSSTKDNETFLGWWTDPDCTEQKVTESTIVNTAANHTLYAKHMPFTDGGWVFYDKGVATEGWRYLAAAAVDAEDKLVWGPGGTDDQFYIMEWPYTPLGGGLEATNAIVSHANWDNNNYAPTYCANLAHAGHDDWYLPNVAELKLIYAVLHVRGFGDFGQDSSLYWSSLGGKLGTDYRGDSMYVRITDGQSFSPTTQLDALMVRPIRRY